jgi:hypothetical protein
MNAATIDLDRQHSTSLTKQIQAHVMGWDGFKGYASKTTAARALRRHAEQLAADGLLEHFALVQVPEGHRHAGRFLPTLGWEANAKVHVSGLVFCRWLHTPGFLIYCY